MAEDEITTCSIIRDLVNSVSFLFDIFNASQINFLHRLNWFRTPRNHTESCVGVDPNRNFDYRWMKRGTSDDECSEFYGGPSASSETEVEQLSNFLIDPKRNLKMFITLNSYGNKISFPSEGVKPRIVDEIRDIARAGIKSLTSSNITNHSRFSINEKRKTAGAIDQFAVHKARIKYSYSIEARDDPSHSFFVPATSIEQNAREIFEVIIGMAQNIVEN